MIFSGGRVQEKDKTRGKALQTDPSGSAMADDAKTAEKTPESNSPTENVQEENSGTEKLHAQIVIISYDTHKYFSLAISSLAISLHRKNSRGVHSGADK